MRNPSYRPFMLWLVITTLVLFSLACSLVSRPAATPASPPAAAEPGSASTESDPAPQPTGEPGSTPPAPTAESPTKPAETGAAPLPTDDLEFLDQEPAMLPAEKLDDQLTAGMSRYTISVNIFFEELSFEGRQRIEYTNTEDAAIESIYLRLLPNGGDSYGSGSLQISNLVYNAQICETILSVEDSALEVILPEPLKPGDSAVLEMNFSGKVPTNFRGGGYGIYNFTDDVLSLAGWHPILAVYDHNGWNIDPVSDIGDSVYADMALYTVSVTVDTELVIAATGVTDGGEQGEGSVRTTFVSGPAREFYMVMSPHYEVASETVNGTIVNSYYYPEHEDGGQAALDIAVDSMNAYTDRIGVYPYAELDIVETPMEYAAGVEFPGIIIALDALYTDINPRSFFPMVIAHEVAHQWWYNIVGNDVFENPWLDEGLTTFTSGLYYEQVYGEDAYQEIFEGYQQDIEFAQQNGQDDLITESLEHFGQPGSGDYSTVVYTKAALFFYTVRETIGDEAFFQALQSYFAENQYRIAEPESLLIAFEEASGQELDELYQEWLYSAGN